MRVQINVPDRLEILDGARPLQVAVGGQPWSRAQLGEYASRRGVYVHCLSDRILYIGKTTDGYHGTFGERFRRECQEKASGNSRLYRLLACQPQVRTFLMDLERVDQDVVCDEFELEVERKALILEQVLIGVFKPEGNAA